MPLPAGIKDADTIAGVDKGGAVLIFEIAGFGLMGICADRSGAVANVRLILRQVCLLSVRLSLSLLPSRQEK
jgi:hypothetical protein